MNNLAHRLQVYRDRLKNETNEDRIRFYRSEITVMENQLEAEDAVDDMMSQFWTVDTDDFKTISELVKDRSLRILKLDHLWSWRHFKFMWHIEYYQKTDESKV